MERTPLHHRAHLLHGLRGSRADGRPRSRASGHPQVALLLALGLAGCASRPVSPLERGLHYLESHQEKDGSWKSSLYRDMAGGMELTPFCAKALIFSNTPGAGQKGLDYLLRGSRTDLVYPIYTSAGTLLLLSREANPEMRQVWVDYLSSYQLTEKLGWAPKDLDYGGWGYAMQPPRKGGGDPLASANLSSTTFALGALRVSGVSDARVTKALTFVKRCQNPDGGFCTSLSDFTMNKAGERNSYGSASSDGLRALLRADVPASDPAAQKAWTWVQSHFSVEVQPGNFPPARFADRDGLYYYYLWSTAHALAARARAGVKPDERSREMARAMTAAVVARQQEDGSWKNASSASREDDPLVATPMALAVLVLCGEVK